MVDDLLERGIANAARRPNVFTRQMAHRPPVVHLLVGASGHSGREQRSEREKLHGGRKIASKQASGRMGNCSRKQQLLQHSSYGDALLPYYISREHRDGRDGYA